MGFGFIKTKGNKKFDIILIGFLILIMLTSLIAIYSAFGVIGESKGMDYITKQLMWYTIGFSVFAIITYLGNDHLIFLIKILYFFLLACLALLFLDKLFNGLTGSDLPFISTINGATSWFQIPGIGSFQPSEFMKICLIVLSANEIELHFDQNPESTFINDIHLFINILKWAFLPMLFILMQPDTGVVLIIAFCLFIMLACSGIRKEWMLVVLIVGIIAILGFSYLYIYHFDLLNDLIGGEGGYKLKRITSWLNPESDTSNTGMQLYTALLSLGSAGLYGHGMQQFVVSIPEAQTDFIFAMIGQSFGFIGACFVVLLCLALNFYLCHIANKTKAIFDKFVVLGVIAILLYQQVQNIGMIIGLLPITGITLPMISYGGSSLLSYFIAFGIVMNISNNRLNLKEYI